MPQFWTWFGAWGKRRVGSPLISFCNYVPFPFCFSSKVTRLTFDENWMMRLTPTREAIRRGVVLSREPRLSLAPWLPFYDSGKSGSWSCAGSSISKPG